MRKRRDAASEEQSMLNRPNVGKMNAWPQTNLAAVGILAQRGSAADGPELWTADHTDTATPNSDLIYPIFLFASQRVPGLSPK